jgi:hypothetical protein
VSEQPRLALNLVHAGATAEARLADFGLVPDHFVSAQQRGHERRLECGPSHPKTFPGQVMWAETVAALRQRLLETGEGWQIGRTRNYETVFRTDRRIAIAVVGGDAATGVDGPEPPKAARRRGPVTWERIAHNNQLELPITLPPPRVAPGAVGDDEACDTWFFLLNARGDALYSELSMPDGLGIDRRSVTWLERILLPAIPVVGAVTPVESDGDDEAAAPHVDRR